MRKNRKIIWCLVLLMLIGLGMGWPLQLAMTRRAAVLKSIASLASQIDLSNQESAQANFKTMRGISQAVCRNFNKAQDRAVLAWSQQIHEHTQALVDTLHLLRNELQAGRRKSKTVRRLPAQLDKYTQFMESFLPPNPSRPLPSTRAVYVGWFGEFDLAGGSLVAAMASLSKLEAQLRSYERQALTIQAQKVGSSADWFDVIRPLVVPISETVEPGAIYQARLFLAQSGRGAYCNMQMTANGVPLTERSKSVSSGMQVGFAVPPLRPGQPDTVRAHWQGTIRAQSYSTDTLFQVDVPYFIVKRAAR